MRIAIDMLLVEKKPCDLFFSTYTLLDRLSQMNHTNEYIIITGRPRIYHLLTRRQHVRIYPVKVLSWHHILSQHQLLLSTALRKVAPDVLHVISVAAPIGWQGPLVMTLQELPALASTQQSPSPEHLYWRGLLHESIQRSQCIITASEHIRDELITSWSIEGKRICLADDANVQKVINVYREAVDAGRQSSVLQTPHADLIGEQTNSRSSLPKVSVIIPASRLHKAAQALAPLCYQNYAGEIETIVVGPPSAMLASYKSIIPVHPEPIREPGRARNLGAAQATGEILLFLDDDMIVTADWVQQNVRELQQSDIGIVGARMPGKSPTFFARCVDFTNCGYYQHRYSMDCPVGSGSMGIYRSVFQATGGFDETQASDEDMDLCYRIQKLGYRSVYQPEIVVIHDHHNDSFSKLLRYNYRHGFASGLTIKMRHRDAGLKNRLLCYVRWPPLFLLLLPIIAMVAAIRIIAINVRDHKEVLLYAPFILLGKLSYEFGIFMRLVKKE